jgi:hypothetical protein
MPVQIQMPNGGDELVDPGRVLTVREALAHEKDKSPEVQTAIWVGGSYIFPGESLASLRQKLSEAKFADLTAPNGSLILVAMPQVTDRDDPTGTDHENTRSVLRFGPGADAPRLRVREPRDQLRQIWTAAGLPTDIFG